MSMQQNGTQDSGPFQYEKGVFISYAWGGEREEIVNQIDQALQARGVKLISDKRDLGYKGSIREFMERIGKSNCVIVVISDEYLRSPDCMSELMEIAEGKEFRDRIFPIVLDDANIYDPLKRIEYVRYWEDKRAELAAAIGTVDPANLQGIRDDMDLYDRIRDEISGLTSTLKDMNTLTPEMHRHGGYQILADAVVKRHLLRPSVQQKKILDRRLDAAMPKECQVGYRTEVRVLIALQNSKGLKNFLPDFTESGELIDKGDVEAAAVPINFPQDPNTGQILPAHLHVMVDAPDFQVHQPEQQILVPPDKDSGILTFFLTPHIALSIARVSVKVFLDQECTVLLGSVALMTKVSSRGARLLANLWQLVTLPLTISLAKLTGTPTAPRPRRSGRRKLPPTVQAAIIGAIATLCAAMWATGIGPLLIDVINSALAPPTATPTCITQSDVLVRLHIRRGGATVATLAPFESVNLEPGLTFGLELEIQSASEKPLPSLDCAWTNTGIATDGEFVQQAGCNADYESGHTRIVDTISVQLSQPSCSALTLYSFFISEP